MRFLRLGGVLATTVVLAGCGGKAASSTSTAKATATAAADAATPTATATSSVTPLTSQTDLAGCAVLEQAVTAVSQLVGHTTEGITQALDPKSLAKEVGTAQQSLLDSAKLVDLVKSPPSLSPSQHKFSDALRLFAADFKRGKVAAAKGDMATATQELTDEKALRAIQESAKHIDDLCGA